MKTKTFREKAQACLPALKHWCMSPVGTVEPVEDPAAWQGVSMRPAVEKRSYGNGERVFFDFGEHAVGHVELELALDGVDFDSPLFLRFLAAELPYEFSYRREEWTTWLSQAWMQEDFVKYDTLPAKVRLPRRYAFRYLMVEVVATPNPIRFRKVRLRAESSAGRRLPPPPQGLPPLESQIWEAGVRTLRNCMQTVFEDGPKRDRRLWLGDLRLEALVNAVTYRNPRVVERSLYVLAAAMEKDGIFPSCAYEGEMLGRHGAHAYEYPFLLPKILVEHIGFYQRRQVARDLYQTALLQFKRVEKDFDRDGLLHVPPPQWSVIDQNRTMDKTVATHCAYIYGLEAMAQLSDLLGKPDAPSLRKRAAWLRKTARAHWLQEDGFFATDRETGRGDRTVASQVWAILAEVVTGEEAADLLKRTLAEDSLVAPMSPYLQHFLLEACRLVGNEEALHQVLQRYWGAILKTGASTFYEVFKMDDPFYSPYKQAWVNSACHAWSCTPVFFLAHNARETPRGTPHPLP